MGFARGDLTRRAALADNLAVPEPWSSNDSPRVFAAIRDLRDEFRQLGITDEDGKGRLPDFLLDYENLPPIKPTTLDRAHTRNSSATRWDQNGNLVEDSSDTLRLQRDPASGDPLGLLYEPKRTQILGSPTDPSGFGNIVEPTITTNAGTAKGQPFAEIDGSTGSKINENTSTTSGAPVAGSMILSGNGEAAIALRFSDGTDEDSAFIVVDFSNGTIANSDGGAYATLIDTNVKDLGGGFYRIEVAANPNFGFGINLFQILLQDNVVYKYLHAQVEESREVTTPILTGNATRGADEVDYRFDFPDRTTGVAYSIEQQSGGFGKFSQGLRMGTTIDLEDHLHGVLMYGDNGLLAESGDGDKIAARNTNDDANGKSPLDETIDRLEMRGSSSIFSPIMIIHQLAIHRKPHTATQLSNLDGQYLTQG